MPRIQLFISTSGFLGWPYFTATGGRSRFADGAGLCHCTTQEGAGLESSGRSKGRALAVPKWRCNKSPNWNAFCDLQKKWLSLNGAQCKSNRTKSAHTLHHMPCRSRELKGTLSWMAWMATVENHVLPLIQRATRRNEGMKSFARSDDKVLFHWKWHSQCWTQPPRNVLSIWVTF